ncbi:MYG1 exonuclease isoform X1 [Aricia agestis]|uniref:MYG1 exonuclease isoform X1 n=2 Tax=Aricia agestis TaxID=91739 RepID=UPI001C205EA1|nr:MYG1 exonuclease isoform X1 [Aricia agestis]
MLRTVNKLSTKYITNRCFSSSKCSRNIIMQIGTHDGTFHCDEVLACYMLRRLPEYKDAEIVRSRDIEVLKACDIVVDVGAVFDHQKKRYDHHQREFNETLSSVRPELGDKYQIKLSSAGLVYAFYGERVIKEVAPKNYPMRPESLELIFKKVYENFIEEIDAIDNGVPMTDEEPKYRIHTHLSARVHRLNPDWNTSESVNTNILFKNAMKLVEEEFLFITNYYITVWLAAREFVKSAVKERFDVHESGQILYFNGHFPWKDHLFELEAEMGLANEVKYVVFNDKPNSWRVQAVPLTPGSFVLRKPLHADWRGVRDEELSNVAGIPDCIFCHTSGFIGGNKTKDGAIAMALASLKAA